MMKRFFCLMLIGMIASVAFSQAVTIPYVMSFEESEAAELNSNWHLNPGAAASNCHDEWIVGNMVKSDGKRSLYVHIKDSTDTPTFLNFPNLQFVYRDFVLPAGTFNISFDWLNAAPSNAPMYVGFVSYKNTPSNTANLVTANSTSGVLPSALSNANNSGPLFGQSTWQSFTFPNPLSARAGTTYRFYIAWANNCSVDTAVMGGCIDNIQITDARCLAPSNITAASIGCDSVVLNWTGASDSYEVQYRKQGQNAWSAGYSDSNNPTSALLEGLNEGSYDFRVRGVCHDELGNPMYSAWANYEGEFLIYCKELHCITYFDLDDPATTCYYGSGYNGYSTDKNAAYEHVGKVDYGTDSQLSRHTVNWDKSATDPRTNNLLKLVPQGSIASVRLGNWETGAEAEAVSYQYVVDSALSILLLKYAVVLEDPNHGENDQPRFVLEILDQNNQLIDPTCGAINFAAHAGASGWQTVGSGYNQVTFKDWSTIGLNLDNYAGQQITIRLTTYDCAYSGHYGYAYFTLDCASATLQTTSCGENTSLTAEAPDGFNYLWTDETGATLGTQQTLNVVTSDTIKYTCRLTNKEEPSCWFELSVKALPQFPVADFTYKYDPQDCKNRVVFTNKSYIETRYNGNIEKHYDELAGYAWSFGDGETSSQKNNVHIYPQSGGTFTVSLTGWIAEGEGACRQDTTLTITIPAIGDQVNEIDTAICQGSYIMIDNEPRTEPGRYTVTTQSSAGCTIIDHYNLTIHPTHQVVLPDTSLCFGDILCFDGDCYDKTTDGVFVRTLSNMYNCDSVVVINVHFADEMKPTVDLTQMSETILEASVRFGGSGYTYYTINGGDPQTDTEITGLDAGIYDITFYNEIGCDTTETINVIAPCLRDLIFQRWNDVLSIKNEANQDPRMNGGRTLKFLSYQWKKDGVDIEGATKSYYYEQGGLTVGAHYTCAVMLEDSTYDETCPYIPAAQTRGVSVSPTRTATGQMIHVDAPEACTLLVYNTMGVLMGSVAIEAGDNYVMSPYSAGIYILNFQFADFAQQVRISVTE